MPFEDEWFAHEGELDAAFGESFLFEPRAFPDQPGVPGGRDPNGRDVPSLTRPLVPFSGVFVDAGASLHAHGRSMADSTTRSVASERPMIDISSMVLVALGQNPAQGDRIHRLKTGQVYGVTTLLVESPVRAWINLTEKRERADTGR